MNRSLEKENLFKEVEEHLRKIGMRYLETRSKQIHSRETKEGTAPGNGKV